MRIVFNGRDLSAGQQPRFYTGLDRVGRLAYDGAMSEGALCRREDLWVEVEGGRLAVRRLCPPARRADSEPIVLLHEGLGCIDLWRRFPEMLAEHARREVVLYDRLGHGRSQGVPVRRGIDYLHRAVEHELTHLLEQLGIEHPTLLGHSDGGTMALLYGAKHDCTAIVTVAAHAAVEAEALAGIRQTVERWRSTRLRKSLERYHGDKAARLFEDWSETWLAEWFREWSIFDELLTVRCPVLVVQGEDDEYASRQHPLDIAESLGGPARAEILPGCGHSPHIQDPRRLLKRVARWLEVNDARV